MAEDLQCPVSPSPSKTSSKDSIFEPTVDMMVNDFDDERTLEEEEAIAAQDQEDPSSELSSLQKESDMPLEELLALYKIPADGIKNSCGGRIGTAKRVAKRRKVSSSNNDKNDCETDEQVANKRERKHSISKEKWSEKLEKDDKSDNKDVRTKSLTKPSTSLGCENEFEEDDINEEDDNLLDVEEDESEYEDEDFDAKEESHLKKLYPETYVAGDKRLLRTLSRQQSDEEEDGDYSPDEDELRKTIMVGNEYQAVIPEGFSKYDDVLPYENEDKLLWDPSRLNEENIVEFLTKAQEQSKSSANTSSGSSPTHANNNSPAVSTNLRDDEQALFLLLQCGYNVEEALRRKRINPLPPTDQMSIWSEEECRNFESVIRLYGKDFHTIKHAKVHTRSVGELVQFYYLWKKTERHDVFANKARLEKKKYNVHPGLTDYMDKFLEELDSANNQNCNSSSNSSVPIDRSSSPSSSSYAGGNIIGGNGTTQTVKCNIELTSNETETLLSPQNEK